MSRHPVSTSTDYDSTVICEYLDEIAGGDKIIPKNIDKRDQVLTNHALAQGLCESIIALRYESWIRPETLRWSDWINDQWDTMERGLNWFERNPSSISGPINIAQITLGCFLGYLDFRWPDNGWRTRFPVVSIWFEGISKRDSFSQTVPCAPPPA